MKKPLTILPAFAVFLFTMSPCAEGKVLTVKAETQAAINNAIGDAVEGDTILFLRGNYSFDFALKSGVVFEGEEAAETNLTGNITAPEGEGGTLRRFTIKGAGNIVATNPKNLIISNNVFWNVTGTAIAVSDTETANDLSNARIENNTFFENANAIVISSSKKDEGVETNVNYLVKANIFDLNTDSLEFELDPGEKVTDVVSFEDNDFYSIGSDTDIDPEKILPNDEKTDFVNESEGDFHLKSTSSSLNEDGSEQGAYGGDGADPIPFAVKAISTISKVAAYSVKLSWAPNLAHNVVGYRIYYGTEDRAKDPAFGEKAKTHDEPVNQGEADPDATIGDLTDIKDPPATPDGLEISTGDERLYLMWNKAEGADGYIVRWGTDANILGKEGDAGNAQEYTIEHGLENETTYFATVEGYSSSNYYFAVKPITGDISSPNLDILALTKLSGEQDRSIEIERISGDPSSPPKFATPQKVSGFPALSSRGGCFIGAIGAGASNQGASVGMGLTAKSFLVGTVVVLLAFSALLLGGKLLPLLVFSSFLFVVPSSASAADRPLWSVNLQGGMFRPAQEDWYKYYRSDSTEDWKAGLGLWLSRRFLLGAEGGYRNFKGDVSVNDKGEPLKNSHTQELTVYPVQAYLLFEGTVKEDQLLVPFVAAGYSRYFYRLEVDNGSETKGKVYGWHYKLGLKLLLNSFEPKNAGRAKKGYGIDRTLLTFEAQRARVDDFGGAEDIDLGGWSYYGGVSVDF